MNRVFCVRYPCIDPLTIVNHNRHYWLNGFCLTRRTWKRHKRKRKNIAKESDSVIIKQQQTNQSLHTCYKRKLQPTPAHPESKCKLPSYPRARFVAGQRRKPKYKRISTPE